MAAEELGAPLADTGGAGGAELRTALQENEHLRLRLTETATSEERLRQTVEALRRAVGDVENERQAELERLRKLAREAEERMRTDEQVRTVEQLRKLPEFVAMETDLMSACRRKRALALAQARRTHAVHTRRRARRATRCTIGVGESRAPCEGTRGCAAPCASPKRREVA